jgi:hypothetical protein
VLLKQKPSVHCAIVGFVELVKGEIHGVCGDGLSVEGVGSLRAQR